MSPLKLSEEEELKQKETEVLIVSLEDQMAHSEKFEYLISVPS